MLTGRSPSPSMEDKVLKKRFSLNFRPLSAKQVDHPPHPALKKRFTTNLKTYNLLKLDDDDAVAAPEKRNPNVKYNLDTRPLRSPRSLPTVSKRWTSKNGSLRAIHQ